MADPSALSVTCEVTFEDLDRFNAHFLKTMPVGRLSILRTWLLLVILEAILVYLAWPLLDPRGRVASPGAAAFVTGLFFAISGLPLALWARMLQGRRIYRKSPGAVGRHTVEIGPEGIHRVTTVSDSRIAWTGVHSIAASSGHILFYLSPLTGFLVPRRAFETPEASEEFFRKAREWHAAAAGGKPVTGPVR